MNNMKVKQLSIFLQNKKGSLYDVLETLSEHDINIKALSLFLFNKTISKPNITINISLCVQTPPRPYNTSMYL